MANVVYIDKYINKKNTGKTILDMICDSQKRKETYEYYDNIYQDTEEEKQIFEAWRKRRARRKY